MPKKKNVSVAAVRKSNSRGRKSKLSTKLLGMKDLLGEDSRYYDGIVAKAREFARLYGFSSVKTPIMESYDLYKKSRRRESGREFYSVEAEKGQKTILRPELTQGIIRAYINNQSPEDTNPGVSRLFSLGPVFRRDKLQTGHYRQSTQADWEIIGDDKPLTEALLIALAYNFFNELGIKFQLQINSIGDSECRREYCSKLVGFYRERGHRSKLCNQCKLEVGKNCLSLLDCKEEGCVQLHQEAPQIADYLSVESREHFTKTLEFLDELNIDYNFNPYLVRGLNYYNDTVFEFWPINEKGEILDRLSLAGGGRYDSLMEDLSGTATPAVGLAIGLERTLTRIKDKLVLDKKTEDNLVFLAQLGGQAKIKAAQLFVELYQAGFRIRQSLASDSLKAQLEEATFLQARTSLILGKKEIMDGTVLMRDMDSGSQETVVYKKIKDRLSKKDKLIEKRINNRKEGGLYGRL